MSFLSRSVKAGSRTASMVQARTFASTPNALDFARVSMVGRLVRDPEVRKTKNDQDYVTYDLAVSQGFTAADEHGNRQVKPANFYKIWSFRENTIPGLTSLTKGTRVIVEADITLEPREGEDGAKLDPRPFFTHRTSPVIYDLA
ncbi:hypothetical protein QFC24_000813 [Naganishia onofrii]|uniref:Uncharacterized protein n=1 Tax=Naganishia onofrii TaxID=1851511 RepID=A0ACC2XWL0_9TREE|nr:hypothetical protein QFC24_000813 [Naganishia onofrii]